MANPKDRYGQPLKKPIKRNGCHSISDGDKKHFNRIVNINWGYNDPRLYNSCRCSNTPKLLKIELALRKKMKIRRQKLMKKREQEVAPMGL